jgi:hypothetical protein
MKVELPTLPLGTKASYLSKITGAETAIEIESMFVVYQAQWSYLKRFKGIVKVKSTKGICYELDELTF